MPPGKKEENRRGQTSPGPWQTSRHWACGPRPSPAPTGTVCPLSVDPHLPGDESSPKTASGLAWEELGGRTGEGRHKGCSRLPNLTTEVWEARGRWEEMQGVHLHVFLRVEVGG